MSDNKPEPIYTVTQSALGALLGALQQHLNNKQAANQLLATSDQQLVTAWREFERALVPVGEQGPALVSVADAP